VVTEVRIPARLTVPLAFALALAAWPGGASAQVEAGSRDPRSPRPLYEQRSHLKLARLAFESLPAGPLRDELAAGGERLLGEETGFACSGADDSGDSLLEGDWEEDCNFHFLRHFWDADTGGGLGGAQDARSYAEEIYGDAVGLYLAGEVEAAWYELGRVLHLLQDLANPAHGHLDAHGSADPSNNFEALTDELFEDLLDDGELDGLQPLDARSLAPTPCPPRSAGSPQQAQPLFRLFLHVAETADFFESGDVAGESDCVGGGESAASFAARVGHPAGAAPPSSGAFTAEHLEQHADVLLPLAIAAGAGLLELFWADTHEDADGDGVFDGLDPCPDEAVDDADGDGACAGARYHAPASRAGDACPLEPSLLEPGACGCLRPSDDSDADGDGVPDCVDACPEHPDPGQEDGDGDGVGDACSFRVQLADGFSSLGLEGVDLGLQGRLGAGCLASASLRLSYDHARVIFNGVSSTPACEASATPVADGEIDLDVSCAPGVSGDAELLSLSLLVPPTAGVFALFSVELTAGTATDCFGASVPLAPRAGGISVGCVAGDLDDDGLVDLGDLLAAREAQDPNCLDLAPATSACAPRSGASACCPDADGVFDDADRLVLRALVAGVARIVCETCPPEITGAGRRLIGDLAPSGGGDGRRDVSDVLRLLRFAVGLETATGEERLRGDIAGDGRLDVGDVLALLRDAVQLDSIDWPERALRVSLDAPATLSAWSLSVRGWPAWAMPSGFDARSCPDAPFGGMDASGTVTAVTCAPDAPAALAGVVATFRYRAAEALDVSRFAVESQALDVAGDPVALPLRLD
jgi:hypothetical protein